MKKVRSWFRFCFSFLFLSYFSLPFFISIRSVFHFRFSDFSFLIYFSDFLFSDFCFLIFVFRFSLSFFVFFVFHFSFFVFRFHFIFRFSICFHFRSFHFRFCFHFLFLFLLRRSSTKDPTDFDRSTSDFRTVI